MSEARDADTADTADTDTFDTEFAAARAAEFEGEEGGQEGAAEAEAEGEEEGGQLEPKTPAELRAEQAEKRLQDTQKAMKAERRKRQELEKRFEALERNTKSAAEPVTPEALLAKLREDDEDPIGDIATVKQLAKLLVAGTQEDQQAAAQTAQRAQALNTVATTMKDYEDDFRETNPDYDKAAQHFMAARMDELKDTGLEGAALNVAMQNDFAGIVTRSINAGKDPAEIIYNMSLRRGFQTQKANAKLATIERGQAQSKTLPGGGTTTNSLSAGKVAELSGAAFDAAFEKLRKSERGR